MTELEHARDGATSDGAARPPFARDRAAGDDGAARPSFANELERCATLLARHWAGAVHRFGAPALGVIDLPSLSTGAGRLAPDQIRAAAVLYWAGQVEEAGIPGFAESLAAGLVQGRLMLPFTTGGDRLMQYWRARHERLDADERTAIYGRLFGTSGGEGHPFPAMMLALCNALGDIGRASPQEALAPLVARAREHASELAALLSEEAVGMTAFAGRDIVANVRGALALLRERDIALTLGAVGAGIWVMIRRYSQLVMGRAIDPQPALERASAGLAILSWLADNSQTLPARGGALDAAAPVVAAALTWLAATGTG
jgi:hypothetical protein